MSNMNLNPRKVTQSRTSLMEEITQLLNQYNSEMDGWDIANAEMMFTKVLSSSPERFMIFKEE